jgi:hypothetical protein
MPLQKIQLKPGLNKQTTPTGAEGQWIDCDNVRFRYGQPEKIGGWQELTPYYLSGPVRAQLTWNALDGKKYAALGTSKVLIVYYEGQFFDITPLDTSRQLTSCTFTTVITSRTVTVNKVSHGLLVGEYIQFSSVTAPSGSGYSSANFTTNNFEVITKTTDTFTITMATAATGNSSTSGSATCTPYVIIGPIKQTPAYGWGTSTWGLSTWGTERPTTNVTLEPGSWSLDNFGQILIATIHKGKTYTWDPSAVDRFSVRATILTGCPTKSILTLTSDRDRHLFAFGTETTTGDPTTFDPMLIRWSNTEDYTDWNPTVTNSAGTFRLDTGNTIIGAIQGKDYILVLTDNAAYTIQFVGPPFVFSVRQVGTNCGCIGQHGMAYVQGAVWWIGYGGGFFAFDGTVKQVPSLVQDWVFTTDGSDGENPGINYGSSELVYAYHNSLYNEVGWFYPTATSDQVDARVVYNFLEDTWAVGTLARTTYDDALTFDKPYATEYTTDATPTFPVINGATNQFGASRYWAHEIGYNQVDFNGIQTAIPSYLMSGDYDISEQGLGGDGQLIMRVRRFVPDFKNLVGDALITLYFRDYPANADSTPSTTAPEITGPFTITSSTTKVDTRVRGRQVSLRIENTGLDQNWRYGTLRLDIEAGGRR